MSSIPTEAILKSLGLGDSKKPSIKTKKAAPKPRWKPFWIESNVKSGYMKTKKIWDEFKNIHAEVGIDITTAQQVDGRIHGDRMIFGFFPEHQGKTLLNYFVRYNITP